ncbi:hypothetical protein D3C79_815110 [compost metagenome]
MGTPENQRIATCRKQGLQVTKQQLAQLQAAKVTRLDQLDQPRARLGDHAHIVGEAVEQGGELGALQGAGSGQNTDHAGTGGSSSRLHRRLHAYQRPVRIKLTQVGNCCHGSGVTGQHHRLGTLRLEKLGNAPAALADVVGGFLAIRHMPAIGHIEQRLAGQQALDLSQDRQTADPGVHHADRRRALSHRVCHIPHKPGHA